jgi:uncharacterized protein (UPF0333 family)
MFLRDSKGQVSFEYLLTVVFAILLVVVVTVFALNLRALSNAASNRIAEYKDAFFKEILG